MSWTFRIAAIAGATAVVFYACGPAGEPLLSLTARPRTIDNLGQISKLTITATTADMKPGTGKVRLSAPVGSLKTPVEVDLLAGEATADFTCAVASDTGCAGQVRITAEWVVNTKLVEAVTSITVSAGDSGAGGGGGSDDAGADSGTGGGGGDGGMGTDGGGLTLTAARTTLFKSFGDSTTITAALAVPAAGTDLLITTTLGELSQLDGGSAGTSLSASTDSAGQAQVRFAETGVGGVATITAMAAGGGVSGSTTVRVLEVANVQHTATQCGSTMNCSVMGIRNSGFNETAQVRFRVSDSMNQPVAAIQVSFSLNNAPAGVTVTPSATTNAMGIAEASVQSGLVVGSFTVTASVGGGALTADSPTIGVRGAKPSNQGFTMQCAKTNLATYLAPTPPLGIMVACTLTLVDRFGNPVGRVTSVNLNSEAGALPPTIMTTGYSPTGGNMNEGKGMLTLSTVGPFPALDVTPLPADGAQYPYPRLAEPSTMDGALTRNPRDGLVTILAYTDGEEHYYDDNSNGMRDSNERFIDQGEPFTDANDNNQWDPGEFYNDVDGSGGWTPANGTWDANAKIWTVAHVLYTDASRGSLAQFSPSSFSVAKGTQQLVDVYMPDQNLNHIEAGAGASAARTASKGQIALVNLNLALDGFGFAFEARRLVNAAGTGPCDPTTPICSFRTLFGDWGRGYIGQLRLTGAATTDMTPAAPDTITVTTTVRGVAGAAAVSGTFQ